MIFARFFALFFFFASFGIVASVPAAAVQKRQDTADIATVLNTLKGSTDTILPQITSLTQSGNVTEDSVTPLINDLTTALNTASSSLSSLSTSSRKVRRQSDDDIAQLVASLIEDITGALDGLVGDLATIPALGGLLSGVDVALNQVLVGLEVLLAGVLNLVATLLVDVAALLRSLAFGLTLASLGL